MTTFNCCVPDCKSMCVLSPRDKDRQEKALVERGWMVKDGKHYCPVHHAEAMSQEKPGAEPVPPAE